MAWKCSWPYLGGPSHGDDLLATASSLFSAVLKSGGQRTAAVAAARALGMAPSEPQERVMKCYPSTDSFALYLPETRPWTHKAGCALCSYVKRDGHGQKSRIPGCQLSSLPTVAGAG
eukprot:108252-Pelagomonas_calceolata.AAC.1